MRTPRARTATTIAALAMCAIARVSLADETLPVAADAGVHFVFHTPAAGTSMASADALPEFDDVRAQLRKMFGVELWSPDIRSRLGVDAQRPVLLSWGIADPAALGRLRALPAAPGSPRFTVRFWLVVPVVDPMRAATALDEFVTEEICARPGTDRWKDWLARLRDDEDQRAARVATDARYICLLPDYALVARLDGPRRELRWTVAMGVGPLVAAAAATPALDTALGERLRQAGLPSASAGFYAMPEGEARARIAVSFVRMLRGLADIPAGVRNSLWKTGLREIGSADRIVDSPPRLFSDLLVVDRTSTWTLTPDGRTFFASLKLPAGADATRLRKAVAAKLRPQGVFASPAELDGAIAEGGASLGNLVRHFFWPHRIAIGAAHPRAPSRVPGGFPGDRSHEVTLDLERGQLRLSEPDAAGAAR